MQFFQKIRQCLSDSQGFTLVELVIIIVVFAIAIPTLMQLSSMTLESSNKSRVMSQASIFAQEKMEEIIADKKSITKGFGWITAPGRYTPDEPGNGYTRTVLVTTVGNIHNGISYAFVEVTVSHDDIPDIKLTMWLTDY